MRQWGQGMLLILAGSTVNGHTLSGTNHLINFCITSPRITPIIVNRKVLPGYNRLDKIAI